jgi:hypothetical protein
MDAFAPPAKSSDSDNPVNTDFIFMESPFCVNYKAPGYDWQQEKAARAEKTAESDGPNPR